MMVTFPMVGMYSDACVRGLRSVAAVRTRNPGTRAAKLLRVHLSVESWVSRARGTVCQPCSRVMTHLLSHVFLEVLVCGDVEAYAPVLEPLGLDLVRRARDRSYDDVGLRETFLQGQGARVHDVPRVVARLRALVRVDGLLGALRVFLC